MDAPALLRRTTLGLLASALGLAVTVYAARADEVAADARPGTVTIHSADQVLRDLCHSEDGVLWLTLPGGANFELITSTADPAITNPGDGRFHAYAASEVRAAIAGARYPLAGIGADVYLLPYPRRSGLESCAGPGLILLSPGVRELSAEHQHAEFTHELGHVVQYARMPDSDDIAWSRWRALRGVNDLKIYSASAAHADRPHEIFAEDFRALFGGPLAIQSGGIENSDLAAPAAVAGLDAFVLGLNHPAGSTTSALSAWPNPSRAEVAFAREGGEANPLEVFDIGGRRVASVAPQANAGVWTWNWDGRADAGGVVGAGSYLARERGASGPALRITRLR